MAQTAARKRLAVRARAREEASCLATSRLLHGTICLDRRKVNREFYGPLIPVNDGH